MKINITFILMVITGALALMYALVGDYGFTFWLNSFAAALNGFVLRVSGGLAYIQGKGWSWNG